MLDKDLPLRSGCIISVGHSHLRNFEYDEHLFKSHHNKLLVKIWNRRVDIGASSEKQRFNAIA